MHSQISDLETINFQKQVLHVTRVSIDKWLSISRFQLELSDTGFCKADHDSNKQMEWIRNKMKMIFLHYCIIAVIPSKWLSCVNTANLSVCLNAILSYFQKISFAGLLLFYYDGDNHHSLNPPSVLGREYQLL